jgi:hypothetical protein
MALIALKHFSKVKSSKTEGNGNSISSMKFQSRSTVKSYKQIIEITFLVTFFYLLLTFANL